MKNADRQYPLPPTGVYTANWIPYGYRYDPDSPEMVVVDQEVAEAIRYLFREYLSGMSLPDIAHQLEVQGYPSPSKRKEQLGLPPRSGRTPDKDHWRASVLNQTVFNPMYAGDLIRSGRVWDAVYYYSGKPAPEGITLPEIEENHHEALISREDMKQASIRYLQEREERTAKSPVRLRRAKVEIPEEITDFSFGSVLRCGECGRSMDEIQMNIGGQPCTAYMCSGLSLLQPSKCTNRFYRLSELMAPILSAVEAERKQALKMRQQVSGKEKSHQYNRIEKQLLRQIDKSVDAVRKNMMETRRIHSQHKSGTLSEQDFTSETQRLQSEDDAYSRQVMDALIRIREFREVCTPENPWLMLYATLPESADLAADPKRLRDVIERIDVFPDKPPEVTLADMQEKEGFLTAMKKPLRIRRRSKTDQTKE